MRKSSDNDGLAGEAYVTVRERILRGELAIGQVISRRKIAAELGMSFLPVSEALLRLEHEGLLESRPRAGTRVRVPTRHDVQGHYVVREALEVQAAMLFATQSTREERAELMKLAIRLDALSTQQEGNRFIYLSLHEKLHRRIAECSRCAALCGRDQPHVRARLDLALRHTRGQLANPPSHHEDLMKVLVGEDPRAAAETMRAHIRTSMANAMRRLEPWFRLHKEFTQTYSRTVRQPFAPDSPEEEGTAGRSRARLTAFTGA